MGNLYALGVFFAGLGVLFAGAGFLWWCSLYEKVFRTKEKSRQQ